jgi:hypothetical protein
MFRVIIIVAIIMLISIWIAPKVYNFLNNWDILKIKKPKSKVKSNILKSKKSKNVKK